MKKELKKQTNSESSTTITKGNKQESKSGKIKKSSVITISSIIAGVVVIALAIYMITVWNSNKSDETQKEQIEETTQQEQTNESSSEEVLTTDELNKTTLSGKELQKVKDEILSRLYNITHSNNYTQAQVGENQFISYMYNDKEECFSWSDTDNNSIVFLNTGKAIRFQESENNTEENEEPALLIGFGSDIDILSTVESVLLNETGTRTVYDMEVNSSSNEDTTYKEYRIDLVGIEAIKSMYISKGKEFADSMVNNLLSQMGEDWEPRVIIGISLEGKDKIGTFCYIVENGVEYTNWISNGYAKMLPWELPKDWYSYDYSNIDETEMYELLNRTIGIVESAAKEYIEEQQETITGEETTNTN